MKLQVYGCLFLINLGLIIGCQDNERISTEKKSASTTSTKTSVSPSARDYNNSGTAYQRAGKLQEAAAAYQRAIEMRPTLIEAHHNLGTVYVMQGKLAEAIVAYKRGDSVTSRHGRGVY